MVLTQLRLRDFRNYRQLALAPPEGITALVGENGAGKTNLLEAVHLCCLGRSHRRAGDRDLVRSGCETGAVHATVRKQGKSEDAGIRLFAEPRRKKLVYINGKTVPRVGELMGHITCVMFSPEDQQVLRGAPMERRRLLDMLLSQCFPGYFYALQSYQSALRQRNAFLRQAAGVCDPRQLAAWDAQLARSGAPVSRARQSAVERLRASAREHYRHISAREEEELDLNLKGTLSASADPEQDLLRALSGSRADDLARGQTGPGPHRDDLALFLSGRELKAYASQGQARTAAIALRLAQIDFLRALEGEAPILLLDDVLSELDAGRRRRLLSRVGGLQTLITCADPGDLRELKPDCLLKVSAGKVEAS